MNNKIFIIKSNGEKQVFSSNKLKKSLRNAGAEKDVIEKIIKQISSGLKQNTTTKNLYHKAFTLLRGYNMSTAHKYNLRNALIEMGPSGFAFEKFVSEILKEKGYSVQVGITMSGWCVKHEVDVSAKKDGSHILVECKFHNKHGIKTDLKVTLYVRERFYDIEKKHEHDNPKGSWYHEGWLVTNTKLTTKAIQYGECAGVRVIGWNYPKTGNLQDVILETGIHPITALTSLTTMQKRVFLDKKVVVCLDLIKKPQLFNMINVSSSKKQEIIKEINGMCERCRVD